MPSMRPSVQRLTDLGVVAAIAAGISVASQSWSGFNSPDSEFYASLALFGSDITDERSNPRTPGRDWDTSPPCEPSSRSSDRGWVSRCGVAYSSR